MCIRDSANANGNSGKFDNRLSAIEQRLDALEGKGGSSNTKDDFDDDSYDDGIPF